MPILLSKNENLTTAVKKTHKSRKETFLDLYNFTGFLYFFLNIVLEILWEKKNFRPLSFILLILDNFYNFKEFMQPLKRYKKAQMCKSFKFNSFVLGLFCIFVFDQNVTLESI